MSQPETSETAKVVYKCVRYILCQEGSKLPIKRTEIKEHLNKTENLDNAQIKKVIDHAKPVLKDVYGFELTDIGNGQYIVIQSEYCDGIDIPTYINKNDRKILTVALAHIYMSRTPIQENEMWKFLIDTELVTERQEAENLLKTFTKQMYLKYTKKKDCDTGEFEWGLRAHKEIPEMFILKKVAEAYESRPEDWPQHYVKASQADKASKSNESTSAIDLETMVIE